MHAPCVVALHEYYLGKGTTGLRTPAADLEHGRHLLHQVHPCPRTHQVVRLMEVLAQPVAQAVRDLLVAQQLIEVIHCVPEARDVGLRRPGWADGG